MIIDIFICQQMVPRVDIPIDTYFLLAIVASTLLHSELEEGNSIMSYNRERIL